MAKYILGYLDKLHHHTVPLRKTGPYRSSLHEVFETFLKAVLGKSLEEITDRKFVSY